MPRHNAHASCRLCALEPLIASDGLFPRYTVHLHIGGAQRLFGFGNAAPHRIEKHESGATCTCSTRGWLASQYLNRKQPSRPVYSEWVSANVSYIVSETWCMHPCRYRMCTCAEAQHPKHLANGYGEASARWMVAPP
jgi:hypothetical protein